MRRSWGGWYGESHRHSLARKGIKTKVELPKRRFYPVKPYNTNIYNENGLTTVKYYNTKIVTFDDKEILLDTGGYRTVSTKDRMNSVSDKYDLGYRVYQKDYDWYVDYEGKTYKFESGQVLLKRN